MSQLTQEQQWEQAFAPALTVICEWCDKPYQQDIDNCNTGVNFCPACEGRFQEIMESLEWWA